MSINWTQQHIVLTGATGGLGSALAKALTARGASLTLVGRNQTALANLADALQQDYVVADITDAADRQRLLQHLNVDSGIATVTGLINNAGMAAEGTFEHQCSQAEAMLNTNLLAPILLINAVLPEFKRRSSFILNVGSVFGSIGFPGQTLYCATKSGLKGFTESLRRELSDTSVRVMYTAPRAIKTSFNGPLMRALNERTNTTEDDPHVVAQCIVRQIETGQLSQTIGFPERLFAVLNMIRPQWLDGALFKVNRTFQSLIKE